MHRGPDSFVWTDGHKSYDWLDTDPAFKHQGVVHAEGEFSKVEGRGEKRESVVTTANPTLWPKSWSEHPLPCGCLKNTEDSGVLEGWKVLRKFDA